MEQEKEFRKMAVEMMAELQKIVDAADQHPFNPIGHYVEHSSNIRQTLEKAKRFFPEP